MSFGNQTSRGMLRHLLGKAGARSSLGTFYISLSSTDPGDDGQGHTEPSGGGYAAVSTDETNWTDPTDANPSVTQTNTELSFPESTGAWLAGASLAYYAVWDHATNRTAANFIVGGAVVTPRTVGAAGETIRMPSGQVSLTLT